MAGKQEGDQLISECFVVESGSVVVACFEELLG